MKKNKVSRRDFLIQGAGVAAGLLTASTFGCSGGGSGSASSNQTWLYQGQRGITAVFAPGNSDLYRQLLPSEFQMPDSPQVTVAVSSYDEVTSPLVPYRAGSVMLLCKYHGQNCLYPLTAVVDNATAQDVGKSLGFPQSVADSIGMEEKSGVWNAQVNFQGSTILQISFTSLGVANTYSSNNPGLSYVNLDPVSTDGQVRAVNTPGEQTIKTINGSATVTADPAEPWSGLLNGAALVSAQSNEIAGNWTLSSGTELKTSPVSIVKIANGRIDLAVEEAISLLGGMAAITAGKQQIMLKPNLVEDSARCTTKPAVIRAIAGLMQDAGKDVLIGEGSAVATGYNLIDNVVYRTKNQTTLEEMQQYIFDTLGYTDLAQSLGIPLINLHVGEMAKVAIANGFVFDTLSINRALTEIDMLCSVPMMKTHFLAGVTLGMKNLMGVYPGEVYGSVRSLVHDQGATKESTGAAAVVVDMVRANKLGLVVIDGSTAMEGQGPSQGDLVKMDVIIAGTNPLATDMVGAMVMGFLPEEIPTFKWANLAGMAPQSVPQIEIRGQSIASVQRHFVRPQMISWNSLRSTFGATEI